MSALTQVILFHWFMGDKSLFRLGWKESLGRLMSEERPLPAHERELE